MNKKMLIMRIQFQFRLILRLMIYQKINKKVILKINPLLNKKPMKKKIIIIIKNLYFRLNLINNKYKILKRRITFRVRKKLKMLKYKI